MTKSHDDQCQIIDIQYLPSQFNPADIHTDNLKLLSDADIRLLKTKLLTEKWPPGKIDRYTKPELIKLGIPNPSYGIIRKENELYAVYKGAEIVNGVRISRHAGRGGFGVAKYVQNLNTNERIIIKSIQSNQPLESLEKEINNLKQAEKLYFDFDYSKSRKGKGRIGKTYHFKILGMKIAEGKSLSKLMDERDASGKPRLNAAQCLMVVQNLIAETQRVHKNFIHRDIKPENFICNPYNLKTELIDYGLAEPIQNGKLEFIDNYSAGTPGFMAPELLKPGKKLKYDEATEVYALGMTIAHFLGLAKQDPTSLERKWILVDKSDPNFISNDYLPADKKEKLKILKFLSDMTHEVESFRPTMEQVNQMFKKSYLNESKSSPSNVLIFNLDDFLKLNEKDRQQKIAAIKSSSIGFANIALIGAMPKNQKDYWQVMRTLEEANLAYTLPVFFSAPTIAAAEKAIKQYMKQSFQVNATVFEMNKENKIKPLPSQSFKKIIHTLASLPPKANPKKALNLPEVKEEPAAKPAPAQQAWKRGVLDPGKSSSQSEADKQKTHEPSENSPPRRPRH